MSHRIFPPFLALLLISATTSQARMHRRHRIQGGGTVHAAKAARGSSSDDEGGALSSDRGISQVESAAVGVLVDEIAHSSRATGTAAAVAPQHRLSPDYYRVHVRQTGRQRGPKPRARPKWSLATSRAADLRRLFSSAS